MARINIEDSLFRSHSFLKLVAALGTPDAALGCVVRGFMTAQKFWAPHKKRIPRSIWEQEELPDALIKCGLAEENEAGIYMRGSEEQFSWLIQKSTAGKASAASKKAGAVEHTSTYVERTSTSSSSSSSSLLSQDSFSKTDLNGLLGSGELPSLDSLDKNDPKYGDKKLALIQAKEAIRRAQDPKAETRRQFEAMFGALATWDGVAKESIVKNSPIYHDTGGVHVPPSHLVDNTEGKILDLQTGEPRAGFYTSDKK